MSVTPAIGAFTVLVPRVSTYQQTASKINTACAQRQLPPAFDIAHSAQSDVNVRITANPTFRFDSFGLALGLRPKLSFHVHYMFDSESPIELGRFFAPICLSDIINR